MPVPEQPVPDPAAVGVTRILRGEGPGPAAPAWGAAGPAAPSADPILNPFPLPSFQVPGRKLPEAEAAAIEEKRRLAEALAARETEMARARQDWEAEMAEAVRQARAQGMEEGRQTAERSAREAYARELEGLRAHVARALEGLAAERRRLFLELEGQAVALALACARKLYAGAAEGWRGAVTDALRTALASLEASGRLVVKVNPADFPVADGERDLWLPVRGAAGEVEVRADPRVPRAGCVVESAGASAEVDPAGLLGRVEEELGRVLADRLREGAGPGAAEGPAP